MIFFFSDDLVSTSEGPETITLDIGGERVLHVVPSHVDGGYEGQGGAAGRGREATPFRFTRGQFGSSGGRGRGGSRGARGGGGRSGARGGSRGGARGGRGRARGGRGGARGGIGGARVRGKSTGKKSTKAQPRSVFQMLILLTSV